MKHKKRKKLKTKRKRSLNTKAINIFISIILSLVFIYIILFIPPIRWKDIFYLPFFLILSGLSFFTLKIFIEKIITIILIAICINSVLIIRLFGYKELYYPILLVGLTITLIYFFTLPEEDGKVPEVNSNNKTTKKHGPDIQKSTRSKARKEI